MDRKGTYSLPNLPWSASQADAVGEQAGRLDVDGHLGDLPLDALEVGDGLAEGLALLHVLGGVHEGPLGQADAAGGHDGPHGVEAQHGQAEPAHLADDVGSAGTRTSSSTSSPVWTPRTPILASVRPTETPSQERSTMKAVIESWAREDGSPVLAKTVYQSASTTPDIQHLVPVSTQPPAPAGPGVGHGPGPHAGHVGAGHRLGQAEAGPELTRRRCPGGSAASGRRCRR